MTPEQMAALARLRSDLAVDGHPAGSYADIGQASDVRVALAIITDQQAIIEALRDHLVGIEAERDQARALYSTALDDIATQGATLQARIAALEQERNEARAEVERLKAELYETSCAALGWQPIETAPKGRHILYFPAQRDSRGRNLLMEDIRVDYYPVQYPRKPTLWMPLPAPPRGADTADC